MNSNPLVQHDLTGSSYGYSAADMENLAATEYTLINICVDVSISVSSYKQQMEEVIANIVKSCQPPNPKSDNLMIRLVAFSDDLEEIHGFKQLPDCNLSDYQNCLHIHGSTALFDALINSTQATINYANNLYDEDYDTNGIVIVITDGVNYTDSTTCEQDVTNEIEKLNTSKLDSCMIILVGISNCVSTDKYLANLKKAANITQYVSIDEASEENFRKLENFLSQSIISQSKSLGSGAISIPINF